LEEDDYLSDIPSLESDEDAPCSVIMPHNSVTLSLYPHSASQSTANGFIACSQPLPYNNVEATCLRQLSIPSYAYHYASSQTSSKDGESAPQTPMDERVQMEVEMMDDCDFSQKIIMSSTSAPAAVVDKKVIDYDADDVGCYYGRWQAQGGHF